MFHFKRYAQIFLKILKLRRIECNKSFMTFWGKLYVDFEIVLDVSWVYMKLHVDQDNETKNVFFFFFWNFKVDLWITLKVIIEWNLRVTLKFLLYIIHASVVPLIFLLTIVFQVFEHLLWNGTRCILLLFGSIPSWELCF